jgi:hypothetical protein
MNSVRILRECPVPDARTLVVIRATAWASEGFVGEISEAIDAHDLHAVHWLAVSSEKIVGAIRVCFHHSQLELPDQELLVGITLPPFERYCSVGRLVISPGPTPSGRRHSSCKRRCWGCYAISSDWYMRSNSPSHD